MDQSNNGGTGMNILHISPFVPDVHANHAGGVCMGKQVEALKKKHNVTVLTFVNNEYERKLIQNHPDYEYVETSALTFVGNILLHLSQPNMFAIRNSRTFKKKFLKIIEEKKIDAIHAEYTAMGQYVWVKEKYPNIIFHMTEHDVTIQSYTRQVNEAKGLKKIYCQIETNKVKKCEKEYLGHSNTVMTFNDKDANLLKDIYHCKNVEVLNPYYGVDFNHIPVVEKIPNSICFVGQMGRDENHVAAMRLIDIFKQCNHADWKLNIIGAYPKDELKAMECENIHITGFVDDINTEILKNEIAVFPLTYGAGIKLKVLLAFGLGLPVITTSVGAEGIDEEGKVLNLVESDEEIKNQIIELLSHREALEQKRQECISFVHDKFNWEKTEAIFDRLYPVERM